MNDIQLIVIGVSSGGVEVLQQIFSSLDKNFRTPIAIVHHLPADFEFNLDLTYRRLCSQELKVAHDKMKIEPGKIYFAPSSYHLQVEKDFTFSLSVDEPVHYSRPSIDVLFESAAAIGKACCGILMTGSSSDGAQGLLKIHKNSGITIVQSLASAQFSYMPEAALKLFQPTYTMDTEHIIEYLNNLGAGNVAEAKYKNFDC